MKLVTEFLTIPNHVRKQTSQVSGIPKPNDLITLAESNQHLRHIYCMNLGQPTKHASVFGVRRSADMFSIVKISKCHRLPLQIFSESAQPCIEFSCLKFAKVEKPPKTHQGLGGHRFNSYKII